MSRVFEAMQDELAKESAVNELGLGKKVELSLSGKITGVSMDAYYPDRMVYQIEIRDDKGVFLSTVSVLDSMIVRMGA
jgi:hypothetical protein